MRRGGRPAEEGREGGKAKRGGETEDEVNECLGMFEKGRRVVVFEDMNGRVGEVRLG